MDQTREPIRGLNADAALPAREPILGADAAQMLQKANAFTQTTLGTTMGQAVRTVIKSGPEGLMQQLSQAAQNQVPDPLAQMRRLVAEQGQHFENLRGSIAQIGQSLAAINAEVATPAGQHQVALLNAQAEAIQGLTLLSIKGQQLQAEMVKAIEAGAAQKPAQHPMQKYIYYMVGFMMVWSMIQMIF